MPFPTSPPAGTPILSTDEGGTGGSVTVHPHLFLGENVLYSLLSPQWQTQCLVHSKRLINVCWMNESWMEGKGSKFMTPANTQSTSTPCSSSQHLESKAGLYQEPTKKWHIDCQPIWFADRKIRKLSDTSRYSKLKNIKNFIQAQLSHIYEPWLKGQILYFTKFQTPENDLLLSYLQPLYVLLLTINLSLESEESPSKKRPKNLKIINNLPPSSGSNVSSQKSAPNIHCTYCSHPSVTSQQKQDRRN